MSPTATKTNNSLRRAALGFDGGQVLSLRLEDKALKQLRDALSGAKTEWLEVETSEGASLIKLSDVNYLRVESDEHRVGF
jgi:hypothetical protein